MATFRHATPGAILASKRYLVKDAVTSDGDTKFTITQPANSTVHNLIVRCTKAITIDTSGSVTVKLGTAEGGSQAAADNAIISSGTTVVANKVLVTAGSAAEGDDGTMVTDERTLHVTINADQTLSAGGQGDLEIAVTYRIFD
tara:strand:- start:41 stop:469 length:429 start_codon:yes stop_codon:yes gene_type:complete